MTVYAYYRVSTGEQNYESQKLGVVDYCNKQGFTINKEIIDEGVSGSVKAKDRNLWKIVKNAKSGDYLIVSELSRIGRSTVDVLETCNTLAKKGVNVYFIKQNMGLDQTPMGKMMIAILSAFAEMERDLIRQRTVEGIARARAEGKQIGRPYGMTYRKCEKNKKFIEESLKNGVSLAEVARQINCTWGTLWRYVKENNYTRNYTPVENKHPIFTTRKDEFLKYLKTARKINYVCKDFDISASTLHKFLDENNLQYIRFRGFYKKGSLQLKQEILEEKITEMKKCDEERVKNYLTAEDFRRMYGSYEEGEKK